jgi:hypothetical protein
VILPAPHVLTLEPACVPRANRLHYRKLEILNYVELHNLYSSEITVDEMDGKCTAYWRDEKYLQYFNLNSEWERQLQRSLRRWMDNIKTNLKVIG